MLQQGPQGGKADQLKAQAREQLVRGLARLLRPLAPAPRRALPARVLVIKPDHLGDVLLLTPALQALRQGLPTAHVTALVGPWGEPMLRGNADVDTLLTCEFPGFTRAARGALWQPYALLLKLALLLRPGRYDAALIARDDHWWGALLALAAGIPRRIGFDHPLVAPALTDQLAWDPTAHVTRQGLALVEHLLSPAPGACPADRTEHGAAAALAPPDSSLRFTPLPADRAWAERWLAERKLGGRPLVAIHPGTAGKTKLWPGRRWATVADALAGRADIIITVGPGEEQLAHELVGAMRARPSLLLGKATLGMLAALYTHCSLVLGVDSLAGHLAASQGTPTIRVYGPSNHARFGPWGDDQQIALRSGLWCSPCGVFERCPRGTSPAECMVTVSAAEVIATAQRQLDLDRRRSWAHFSE